MAKTLLIAYAYLWTNILPFLSDKFSAQTLTGGNCLPSTDFLSNKFSAQSLALFWPPILCFTYDFWFNIFITLWTFFSCFCLLVSSLLFLVHFLLCYFMLASQIDYKSQSLQHLYSGFFVSTCVSFMYLCSIYLLHCGYSSVVFYYGFQTQLLKGFGYLFLPFVCVFWLQIFYFLLHIYSICFLISDN